MIPDSQGGWLSVFDPGESRKADRAGIPSSRETDSSAGLRRGVTPPGENGKGRPHEIADGPWLALGGCSDQAVSLAAILAT